MLKRPSPLPRPTLSLLLSAALLLALALPAAAGPLDPPPGPVAPTGKPLADIEPRTPITAATTPGNASATYIINQPGSFYLAGNIIGESGKHGILIAVSGVTLDLGGFILTGVTGSLDGVHISDFRSNVVIRNGHVRNWGGSGINARIDSGRIERVTSQSNTGWGIDNASASTFTTHIVSCEASSNGLGGIRGLAASLISDCVSRGNSGPAFSVGIGGIVSGCVARANNGPGIIAAGSCLIVGNTVSSSSGPDGHGIHLTSSGNRVEGNNITGCSGSGIRTDFSGNFIVKNSAKSNSGGNYQFIGVQTAGPIITATGTIADTVSPWANFSF